MDKFDLFAIDPPWPKKKGGLRKVCPNQTREMAYKTMPVDEIFSLLDEHVFSQANELHTVFLWNVDEFLHEGEEQMIKRGYKRHARLIWNKLNGVAPAFTVRYSHEYISWFYKPKFQPVAKEMQGKIMTVFEEKSRQHSRKPDIFYEIVNRWYPEKKKIDVFSREKREGWSQFGDQIEYFS